MVWVGRSLKDHLVPTPCLRRGHLPLHRVAQWPPKLTLNISRDGCQDPGAGPYTWPCWASWGALGPKPVKVPVGSLPSSTSQLVSPANVLRVHSIHGPCHWQRGQTASVPKLTPEEHHSPLVSIWTLSCWPQLLESDHPANSLSTNCQLHQTATISQIGWIVA